MVILLVAEQDGRGDVAWVWFKRPDMQTARPIRHRHELPADLSSAEVTGAPRQAVFLWLDTQLDQALALTDFDPADARLSAVS